MSKKILLIEDNVDMRDNTAEILELANYDVEVAENGKVGVLKAKKFLPDLIICDIMMPELDGYEVLYLLSKDEKTASVPFIFLTAKADSVDFRKGMNLGADDYITKPFEEMDLLNAIESRLRRTETFRKEFRSTIDGLSEFMDEISGIEELEKLSLDRKVKTFKKKENLYHEGDYPNGLYFIHSGKVKTYKINDDGKELITNLYHAGEFLGYKAILEDENYKESASAIENTEVVKIPRQDFIALIYSNKEVSKCFIKMLSNNLSEKESELLNLAYNSVRKRVADALVLLEDKYKTDPGNFSMAISRDDLASIVGTSTESVIRTISEFKDEGLVSVKGSNITIENSGGLRNLRY
jgi:CRP-like cAMP-binding protein/CheY-like chemotaxis protein